MAVIGSLAVNIVAKTDKFIAGLNQATTGLGRFVKKIGTAGNAAAALGIYGFGAVVKGAIDAGGAIFDLSQKLSISTEALGALHFAAEQMGASASSVNNALAFMSKTLGQAVNGVDAAQKAFARLNIDFRELQGLTVDQQFLTIVEAISKLPNAALRAAAAQAVFGRGAKELAALIAGGTEAIVKFGDEAARTGAVLTEEQAAALDQASDSMMSFSRQWQSMTQQLVSVFAPAIAGAMFVISEAIKLMKDTWNTFQFLFISSAELVSRAILGILELMNILLPKFAEFDTQSAALAVEEFAKARKGIVQQVEFRHGASGGGPLKAPTGKGAGGVQTDKEAMSMQKAAQKQRDKQIKEEEKQTKEIEKLVKKLGTAGVR